MLQVYYYFELNFMDDKLTAKIVKFTSLENLYIYGIFCMRWPRIIKLNLF